MAEQRSFVVREAREADVPRIREIFEASYSRDYPFQGFFDDWWLKRSVFTDDILMLVAEEQGSGDVLGTASVVFDVGAHSDLIGEFGRLAVHPDARGQGLGNLLMAQRLAFTKDRLHVGIVQNRCAHPFSQKISLNHDFAPVGFLVQSHRFARRESIALFCRHFGGSISLRCNHPRITPEAQVLAHLAFQNLRLPYDVILDEDSPPYPREEGFEIEELDDRGMPALIRMERGRVRNREIFGPMRLQYGFFMMTARRATYLVARERRQGPVVGAIGYIRDDFEKTVKVFELISRSDEVIRFLLEQIMQRCTSDWQTEYVEVDVCADAARMQRTLLELGFLPTAYVPAMVFADVERLDVVKMSKLLVPLDLDDVKLTAPMQVIADQVVRSFASQDVRPQIAQAVHRIGLFSDLNREQIQRVAGQCTVQHFAPGEALFAAAEPATSMHILIEGSAEVTMGSPSRKLGSVSAGESLGELALLTGDPHSADATAAERVVTAVLDRSALTELTRRRPDIGVLLYRRLAIGLGRKLQRLDRTLADAADATDAPLS